MALIDQVVLLANKCAAEDAANKALAQAAKTRADDAFALAQTASGDITTLQSQMSSLQSAVAGAFHYGGTVATIADLPNNLTANDAGIVYNVGGTLDEGNYVWNGTAWDSLGKTFTVASSIASASSIALVTEGLIFQTYGDPNYDFLSDYTDAYNNAGGSGSGSGTGA